MYLSWDGFTIMRFDLRKNIFGCLFIVHDTISLSQIMSDNHNNIYYDNEYIIITHNFSLLYDLL